MATAVKETDKKFKLDLTGVEERRGPAAVHVPPGDYLLEVVEATRKTKQGATTKYIEWQLRIVDGAGRGTIRHITSLKPDPKTLWAVRNFLADLLVKDVPSKEVGVDLDSYVGKQIAAVLTDETSTWKTSEGEERTTTKSIIATNSTYPADKYKTQFGAAIASANGVSTMSGDEAAEAVTGGSDADEAPVEVEDL